MDSKHPTLQDPAFVPDEFEDNNHHLALALDHYHIAYDVFLQGQDVFPEQEKVLEERYGRPVRPHSYGLYSPWFQRRRMRE